MRRKAVTSTNIVSVGYDPAVRTLEIEFRGGRIYQFQQITAYRYRKLMTADSKGVYFARMIGGRFPYVRINDEFPFPNEKN
jgi:hypothetical protein